MKKAKCHALDDEDSVDLETWTGRNGASECFVTTNRNIKYIVKIMNWRRKIIDITINGESINKRVTFESSKNGFCTGNITLSGRKLGSTSGTVGYLRDYIMASPSEVGKDETIKTKIVYWNKYNEKRSEEEKEVQFDIDLI